MFLRSECESSGRGVAERLRSFATGTLEIDPLDVGVALERPESTFVLDTSVVGNANTGHEYGTDLAEADKRDLIEYMKTL